MERNMADLVERYIHEVGRYLPQKERAEVEAELRSQIHDQLEDKFGDAATPEQVASVLVELGDPRRMAASYGSQQYLIGPILYPFMMMVLRRGWVIIPIVVVTVHAVVALFSEEAVSLVDVLFDTLGGVVQAMLIFTGIVVLLFAIIERSGEDLDEFTANEKVFDPADLPEVDAPGGVDRFEAAINIAFGAFWTLVLLYFLRVGGLTLRFDLSDPGNVIPVPSPWLILLILNTVASLAMNVLALRRGRWTPGTQLLSSLLELSGAVFFYFAVMKPFFANVFADIPGLANVPFLARIPEIFLAVSIVIVLVSGGAKLVKLWNYGRGGVPSYNVKART
jgi:hypothetical protein